MSTLTYRLVKNAPLTNAELDQNFTNLNTDKLEATTGQLNTLASATTLAQAQANLGIVDPIAISIALG